MTDEPVRMVTAAVDWLADAVADAPTERWDAQAGSLHWTCRRTAEHLMDDLLSYSLQLAAAWDGRGAQHDYLPVVPPQGGEDLIGTDPSAGSTAVATVLRALGRQFTAVLAATGPDVRAYHPWGLADRTGYAGIGLVELLAHGYDILTGLGRPARPPQQPSAFTVARVFPNAPDGPAPEVLLWCTGRIDLPRPDGTALARQTGWRAEAGLHASAR